MQQEIKEQFEQSGLRLTKLRKAMIGVFARAKKPLTVPEIINLLNKKELYPNKTSIYRHIEKFTDNDIIRIVHVEDGATHYELQKKHHHHFVCNECNDVICLDDKHIMRLVNAMVSSLQKKGFAVSSHRLSFEGICNKCKY